MPDNTILNVPKTWYKYDSPLKKKPHAPRPSKANYHSSNVAPLIESFAGMLGVGKTQLTFQYQNNNPDNPDKAISVQHPDDDDYLPKYADNHTHKSKAMQRYERAAKKSKRLALFEEFSPAKLTFFK